MTDEKLDLYLEKYKNYDINLRQNIIIKQLKDLFQVITEMNKTLSIKDKPILNSKYVDLNKKSYNQEEFLDLVVLLTCSLQDTLSDFSIGMMDIAKKIGNMYNELYKKNNDK